MKDPLKEFNQLRAAMLKRQAEIQDELAELNAALVTPTAASTAKAAPASSVAAEPTRRGPRKRASNTMSLAEAVLTVTQAKPLTKPEILAAVEKLGYQFTAKFPLNSLNTLLYTNKKIKNSDGKFGPK